MITTLTSKSSSRPRGFTLVELMISMALLMMALASITGTFMLFARSSVSVGEYVEMSHDSRMALEIFSRDVRSAESLQVVGAERVDGVVSTESGVIFTYPAYHGDRQVQYRYNSDENTLYRIEFNEGGRSRKELLSGLRLFELRFYQTPGDDFSSTSGPLASVDTWAKSIQLDAELIRTVVALDNTDYIISARFMMRNMN